MKTIAFITEENVAVSGLPVSQCWHEIPNARFESVSAAVDFVIDYRCIATRHERAVRVLERVELPGGAVVDNQVYPEYRPSIRQLSARRITVPMDRLWARELDAAQDPVAVEEGLALA